MEDKDNTKSINTKIPLERLIVNTLNSNPKSHCEFNNMLVYQVIKMFLESQKSISGGKNRKHNKKQKSLKNNNKNKLTKYNKKKMHTKSRKLRQKGGTNMQFIAFLIGLLLVFVKGIKNVTDENVIQRIKQANEVSDIFRNYYGTCTLNTMLFLKTIDLPTFEDLSVGIMTNQMDPLNSRKMAGYLNKELDVNVKWFMFSGRKPDEDLTPVNILEKYIERIRSKLVSLRTVYNFANNQSILTVMNYPKKDKDIGHSVILWLTNANEIILVDPQKFIKHGIILYTSELTTKKYLNSDSAIKIESLRLYIRENIDIFNEGRETDILVSLHIEINDLEGKNAFSLTNKNLINTIARIKEVEENLDNTKERGEML
jgi:hypothetical protein